MKYSELKNIIKYNVLKEDDESLAYLTHFIQQNRNEAAKYYESKAEKYIKNYVSESFTQYNLPFEFDVPFPPIANPFFTFIDLFAGIGGFRIAMQNLGGNCVFSSEINKYAKQTYDLNFGEVPFGDITQINENNIPDHDILCAGFPCQSFSIAGKRRGFLLQFVMQKEAA